jgi:hypothetical protein
MHGKQQEHKWGKQQEHKHITETLLFNIYHRKFLQEVRRKRAMTQEKVSSPELVKEVFYLVEPQSSYKKKHNPLSW